MARASSIEEIRLANRLAGIERRKFARFACEGPADVVALDSDLHYHGELKDLSLTGCCILPDEGVDLDRRSDVELSLCVNGDSLCTPARLIVMRPESGGAAFEFLPVDPEMRSALLTLIQKLAAELERPAADQPMEGKSKV